MRWPNGSQTQPTTVGAFGPRKAPTAGASTYHRGTDFTGIGQVKAVAAGRVVVVGTPSGWSAGGKQVWIQHDGFFTKSLHLGAYNVSVGQWVEEGQIIGAQDTTGTATGSHLHLELTLGNVHYRNDGQIDCVPFIRARITTGSAAGGSSSIYDQWGGKAWITAIQDKLKRLGYEITVDGQDGPQTQGVVRDFQGKNGLTVDGVAGPLTNAKLDERLAAPVGRNAIPETRSTVDIQRLVGADPDGIYGPATTAKVMAWQQAHGLAADGIWGPASDAVGFPNVVGDTKLDVDGQLGPKTISALQLSLGFTGADVDGQMGPKTISALQAAVGATVDGQLGPETIKALQRSLGVAIDGDWGPLTTSTLQTLLNNGGRLHPVAGEPETPEPPLPAVEARTALYPGAVRGWTVPLGFRLNDAKDAWIPNTRAGGKITTAINHHTTNPGDEEPYFKTKNSRSSCPTWYVKASGEAIEMIRPGLKPSSTGSANENSLAIEIQNTTTAPGWETSDAALERVADIWAWLASFDGKDLDGVRVDFKLDRQHVIGHSEAGVNATACPGPYILPRLDAVVERAKVLLAEKYSGSGNPDPEPEPEPSDGVTLTKAQYDAILASAEQVVTTLKDAA